jgi:hypothetical protein
VGGAVAVVAMKTDLPSSPRPSLDFATVEEAQAIMERLERRRRVSRGRSEGILNPAITQSDYDKYGPSKKSEYKHHSIFHGLVRHDLHFWVTFTLTQWPTRPKQRKQKKSQ